MSNQQPIISLTTDFGDTFACSQCEVVIHGINPDVRFIIASNQITEFSILEGAFVLQKFYPFSPKGSVHIAVIDPGVGSNRRGIIIQTTNYWFVGPDNGVLYPAANLDGIQNVYVIDEAQIGSLSNTFHGRDIFSKVAAYLTIEKTLGLFCFQVDQDTIVKLEIQPNQVAHVDPYGNIKLSSGPYGFAVGDTLEIKTPQKTLKVPFCHTFADVKKGEFLVYYGSHQTLEIAKNLGDANKELQLEIGDILDIRKIN
jgi:S-adenosyl-L-methionine hydrolase (adenosine-forming)